MGGLGDWVICGMSNEGLWDWGLAGMEHLGSSFAVATSLLKKNIQ